MHKRKIDQKPLAVESIAELLDIDLDGINAELDRVLSQEYLAEVLDMPDKGMGPSSADEPLETRTRHTTIRLPADVLLAFQAEARRRGIGYQTLIIEVLRRHLF